jgi:hypothetical protein
MMRASLKLTSCRRNWRDSVRQSLCEKLAVVRRKRGRDVTHADLGAAYRK